MIGRVNSGGCIRICDKLMDNLNQSEGLTASLPSLPLKIGLKKSQKEGSFPSNHPSSGTVLVLGSSFLCGGRNGYVRNCLGFLIRIR